MLGYILPTDYLTTTVDESVNYVTILQYYITQSIIMILTFGITLNIHS